MAKSNKGLWDTTREEIMHNHILRHIAAGIALTMLASAPAGATIYTFADNWINWPGYTSPLGDENGTPKIDHFTVAVDDSTNTLESVTIHLHDSTYRQLFDSLFINTYDIVTTDTSWDDWDYFVHDGGRRHEYNVLGELPDDGFYRVSSDYAYTTARHYRVGNPNGIDASSLTILDDDFGATHTGYEITYDLSDFNISVANGFFVAYTPWCGNDIIGGGTDPVPEPATMLLLGTGLTGLATFGRKRLRKKRASA